VSQTRIEEQDDPTNLVDRNNEMSVMLDHGMSISGHERHCVFLNTGADERAGERFACISAVSGLDFPDDGRGVSVVDWDHDGDQDLWISNRNAPRIRFLRNDTNSGHNFISLLLSGNGTTTNRDAIGARVEVVLAADDSTQSASAAATIPSSATESGPQELGEKKADRLMKTRRAGEGFLSQSSRWIHFGLGDATKIEKVTVRWPGGEIEEFANLKINNRYKLKQGNDQAAEIEEGPQHPLAASTPELPAPADRFRIPMVALVPMPNLPYIEPSGQTQPLLAAADGFLLINCWSSSCLPCLKELQEFTDRADELRNAGIHVLALCFDEPSSEKRLPEAAENLLKNMGFPFSTGQATFELGMGLNTIHNTLTATGGQLPVPTSFLVDASGRLSAIYKGPVSVDTLLEDVQHSSLPAWDRFRRAANLPGTVIENEVLEKALIKGDRLSRVRLAKHLDQLGWSEASSVQYENLATKLTDQEQRQAVLGNVFFEKGIDLAKRQKWTEAAAALQSSLDNQPDSAATHYNLGIVYQQLGQQKESREHYQQAIRIAPDLVSAHVNLARLLAKEKEWDQAAVHFKKVVLARPNDGNSHYNLGVALVKQDKWKEAAEHFQTALHIRPDFTQARVYLERIRDKQ
jgi:tetratricopeptide (TPR) repeat protein